MPVKGSTNLLIKTLLRHKQSVYLGKNHLQLNTTTLCSLVTSLPQIVPTVWVIFNKSRNFFVFKSSEAALAIAGSMQGTSRRKIYQELGLGSLKSRRWYKRLGCMFKIMKE